jgi:hypothetical protein
MEYDSILIILGIIMMAYSSILSIKIYKIFSTGKYWFSFGGKLKKTWMILPVFIIFFLASYLLYLVLHLKGLHVSHEILTAFILFFGAVFVFIVVYVHYKIFSLMKGRAK